MEDDLINCIKNAIRLAKDSGGTRENAIVLTKLEEALLWRQQDAKMQREMAQRIMEQKANG